jgi:conjugal transfer pilus assembly protein TraW
MKWSIVFILIILIILLSNFIMAMKVHAVDLGVWGESSAIAEEDFETHIVKQLEALGEDKLKAHQVQIKDKIVANIKRPRAVKGITKVSTNTNRFYDPSFTIYEDIYDGKNQLLFPSGTTVNPLEKRAFDEIWIFIDGDDQAQINFAKNYQEDQQKIDNGKGSKDQKEEMKIKKIILLNGSPGSQKDGNFFFFDQAGAISRKLNINKVPSVVRQVPNQLQILIEEIVIDEMGNEQHGVSKEHIKELK